MSLEETAVPPELARVQTFLKDAFRLGQPIPEHPAVAERAAEHVTGNRHFTPAEQADIYRRQFFLRHVDSLIEDHPGIVHFLGDEAFETFACAYLEKHPPHTPSLRDLGADIATFAQSYPGIPEGLRELCTDMARYELYVIEVFDAPDVPPPDRERLAAIPQEDWLTRPLVWSPLLRLFQFGYPVPDQRIAITRGTLASEPPPRDPSFYGIFRRDDQISFERVSSQAYQLLTLLLGGESLTSACEKLSSTLSDEDAKEVESEVGEWFQRWARWGWILDVEAA